MKKHIFNSVKDGYLRVKVLPASRSTEFREVKDDVVVISVKSPAEDNEANLELLKFLKKELGITFMIKSGKTGKNKLLKIV